MDHYNDTDMENLLGELKEAIQFGDSETAKHLVTRLAKGHHKLNIDVMPDQTDLSLKEYFNVTVEVEDRQCDGASFQLLVKAEDKVEDLKRRVWQQYQLPMDVQRWIICKRMAKDHETLYRYNIKGPTTLFLYLLPAYKVGLKRERSDASFSFIEGREPFELVDIDENGPHFKTVPAIDPIRALMPPFNPLQASMHPFNSVRAPPVNYGQPPAANEANTIPKNIGSEIEAVESINNDIRAAIIVGEENDERENVEEEDNEETEEEDDDQEEDEEIREAANWQCPFCTLINPITLQMCEACNRSPTDQRAAGANRQENDGELVVGDRVVWMSSNGPERATVNWKGRLPDTEGITVGVDFDNPVGSGSGKYREQRLFYTQPGYAGLIPLDNLLRERDFQE